MDDSQLVLRVAEEAEQRPYAIELEIGESRGALLVVDAAEPKRDGFLISHARSPTHESEMIGHVDKSSHRERRGYREIRTDIVLSSLWPLCSLWLNCIQHIFSRRRASPAQRRLRRRSGPGA